MPVGAFASVEGKDIELRGVVVSLDGGNVIQCRGQGEDPEKLGQECAQQALEQGADKVLRLEGLDL